MAYNQYAGRTTRPDWRMKPQPQTNTQYTANAVSSQAAKNAPKPQQPSNVTPNYTPGGKGIYAPNFTRWDNLASFTPADGTEYSAPGGPGIETPGFQGGRSNMRWDNLASFTPADGTEYSAPGGPGGGQRVAGNGSTYRPDYQLAPGVDFGEGDYKAIMGSGLKTAQDILNSVINRDYNYPEWWGDKAKAPESFNFYDFIQGPQYKGVDLPGGYQGGIDQGLYDNIRDIANDINFKVDPRYSWQGISPGRWNILDFQNRETTYDKVNAPGEYAGGIDPKMWTEMNTRIKNLGFNIDPRYSFETIDQGQWDSIGQSNQGLGYDKINTPAAYQRLMGGDYNRLEEALKSPAQRAATNAFEQGQTYLDDVMTGRGLYGSSVMAKQANEGLNKRYMDTMADAAAQAVAQRYGMQQSDEQIFANNALQRAGFASGENRADLAARQGMFNNAANLLNMRINENLAKGQYGLNVAQGQFQANNSALGALQNMFNSRLMDTQFGANYGLQRANFLAGENRADLAARQNIFNNAMNLTNMRMNENNARSQYGLNLAQGGLQAGNMKLGAFQDLMKSKLADKQFGANYGLQRSQLERQNLMDMYKTQYDDTMRRQNYLRDQLGWNQGQSEAQRNFYNQMLQGGYQHQIGQDAWQRGIDTGNYNMAMNLMGSTMPLYSNAQNYNLQQDMMDRQQTGNFWGTIGNIASMPWGNSTIGESLVGGGIDLLSGLLKF